MPTEPRRDPAGRALAWFCAASNLAAAITTATLARDGTIANPDLHKRADFMRDHAGLWQLTWLLWMLAALGLLAFLIALYGYTRSVSPTASRIALVLAGAGLALDIGNDSMIAFLGPRFATTIRYLYLGFEAWEAATIVIGVVAANGLYTLAGWVFLIISFRLPGFPRWVALLGLAPWTAATVMAIQAALGRFDNIERAAAILMPTFCLWVIAVAEFYFARRRGDDAESRRA